MSDELATLSIPEGSMTKYSDDDQAGLVGRSFLPRLQVCGSQTEAVKLEQVPVGVWGVVIDKEHCENLGKEVDVLMVSWRPQALKIDKAQGKVMAFHDRNSLAFKKVIADSAIDNRNNLYGLEILVWVPPLQKFTTYFLCSDSARNEAPNFLSLMKKESGGYGMAKATLKLKVAKNAKGTWHIGYPEPCTTPLASVPEQQALTDEVNKFNNPVEPTMPESAPAENRAR